MLRKLIMLLALVSGYMTSYATADYVIGVHGQRFQLSYRDMHKYSEGVVLKQNLLCLLLEKLQAEYLSDTDYVVININPYHAYRADKIIFDKRSYCLSYDYHDFYVIDNKCNSKGRKVKKKAVILNIIADSINLKDCLKLILYGLKHKSEIQTLQHVAMSKKYSGNYKHLHVSANPLGDDSWDYVLIKTISEEKIKKILNKDNHIVTEILKYRYYRNWSGYTSESLKSVSYYIQNDSFYFYETNKVRPKKMLYFSCPDNYKNLDDTTRGGFIAISNIEWITTDTNNNYLVFTSSNRFYHLHLKEKKLNGPIQLPSLTQTIDKGAIMQQSFISKANMATLCMETFWGKYLVDYDMTKMTLKIDTNKLSPELKKKMSTPDESKPTIEDLIYN